jgi:MFS family permease
MAGFGLDYFQPFAVFLKATTLQLGMLSTLPQVVGSASQLLDDFLIRQFKSKKRFVLFFVAAQILLWLPIAFLFYLKLGGSIMWTFIILAVLHYLCGIIIAPAWSAWMGDLVGMKVRGRYFGVRNKVTGYVYFFSYLAAGLVLYYSKLWFSTPVVAFTIMFIVAMLARIASYIYLSKQHEPVQDYKEEKTGFLSFVKEITRTNYGWLTLYLCLANFAVFVASPYFAAYLLNDLHLNYLQFVIVNAAALLMKNLSMPVWGRYSDRYGSLKILTLAGFMVPAVAFMLILSKSWVYLIFAQMFSGIAWAGFDLAAFNFVLDATKPEKRVSYISYYSVLQGFCVFAGSMLGVLLYKFSFFVWTGYAFLFFISGILRYIVAFALLSKLKEVRPVQKIKYRHLFMKVMTSIPSIGTVYHFSQFNGRTK